MTFSLMGLGQCPTPPTCPTGQQLFTVQNPTPGGLNPGSVVMTDSNCPSYSCVPTMTASPVVCNTAQCLADAAALNAPAPVVNPLQNINPIYVLIAVGIGTLVFAPGNWKWAGVAIPVVGVPLLITYAFGGR